MFNIQGLRNTVTPYQDKDGTWKIPTSYEEVYNFKSEQSDNSPMYDWFWGTNGVRNTALFLQDSLNEFYNNSTNWWKYTYHTANVYNANIRAGGGSEKIHYMIGAGYYKEEGIMYGSDYQRVNVLTNISVQPTKRLTLDNQLSLSYTDRSRGNGTGGSKVEGVTVNPMQSTTLYRESLILKRIYWKS
ncbi:MAG: hypothetical protein V8R91_00445 [Butyricimonas faecihominis]